MMSYGGYFTPRTHSLPRPTLTWKEVEESNAREDEKQAHAMMSTRKRN